jgi:hypothetical protein
VIGTDRWRSEPPCARQGVPRGQTESGGIALTVICWSPCAQAVLPDRALCLPTFSHFLIVNKTYLSLSLSRSPCVQGRCHPTGRCAYRPSVTSSSSSSSSRAHCAGCSLVKNADTSASGTSDCSPVASDLTFATPLDTSSSPSRTTCEAPSRSAWPT